MILGLSTWFILSVLIGAYASSLNRSGFLWFVISWLVSPVITILLLLVVGKCYGSNN